MAYARIHTDKIKTILSVVAETTTKHHIPIANSKAIAGFLENKSSEMAVRSYKKDQYIVREGEIIELETDFEKEYAYAKVPLGLVLKGNLIVLKAGKGAKMLSEGDFIGLFETSDWLLTKKSRQIGDWSLVTDSDCEIVFFDEEILSETTPEAVTFQKYLIELARTDHVPQPISSLPLLDWVASHTTRSRLADTAIVVHTHLLPNNAAFFRHLSYLVSPGQIFILEKPYSTVPSVFANLLKSGYDVTKVRTEEGMPYEFATQKSTEILWRKVIQSQKKNKFTKILIVDDGGDLWFSIPWDELAGVQVAGVEQTQRGIARIEGSTIKTPPIVSVASAGIKKLIESEFIGTAVVKKMNENGVIKASRQIGILGTGSIGGAVERALATVGRTALTYDPTYHTDITKSENSVGSIDLLLNKCDLIIGTVGVDSIVGTALERVSGNKVLVSASSSDVEFSSLLSLAEPTNDVFGTRVVKVHENLEVQILNGGYPINFDRIKDSTPDEDIVLTRCLLYIGAMQAAYLLEQGEQAQFLYNLDKISQKHLLDRWIEYKKELGQGHHVKDEDVMSIVNYSSLKDAKEMPTVWED